VIAAHQQITHEWWNRAQERFELFISEAVLEEIRAGDPAVATKRLGVVAGLPVLELRQDVRDLVRLYSDRLNFPPQAQADVLHIAFAVSYGLDYLVTWNCKHIANGYFIRRLLRINQEVRRPTLSF
jgi:hypothetical protein